MHRNILVTGSTGKQGQALIHALLHPTPSSTTAPSESVNEQHTYHVYALTRKASSPSVRRLSEDEREITVVEGDLDVPETMRKIFEDAKGEGGIWGVFSVLAFPGLGVEADGEEKQGKVCYDLNSPHPFDEI